MTIMLACGARRGWHSRPPLRYGDNRSLSERPQLPLDLFSDVSIPEGERVLILIRAANRDERKYADPDRFDVTRAAQDHLAFGHGVHRCAGGRIEVAEPKMLMSNKLHGFESFGVSFH